jgi:hypothetical protein
MVSKENQALMVHGFTSTKIAYFRRVLFLKQIKQYSAVKSFKNELI